MHEVIIRRSGSLLTSFSFFQCSAKMFDVISRRHTRKVNLELSTCRKEALNAMFIIHEFKDLPGDGTESPNPEWEFFSYILCIYSMYSLSGRSSHRYIIVRILTMAHYVNW